jgi:hypothetical protein
MRIISQIVEDYIIGPQSQRKHSEEANNGGWNGVELGLGMDGLNHSSQLCVYNFYIYAS